MNKIICSAKLLHFAKNNNGIAKIDIIKVKLMTQLEFCITKLTPERVGGKCDHY